MEEEKETLVHWYYSVSEWEEFMLIESKKRETGIIIQLLFVWALGLLILRFARHGWWLPAFAISGSIAIAFGTAKYYFNMWRARWKSKKIPEVHITDYMAITNGKQVVFRSREKLLRKVDVKEYNTVNVLEISYEWETGNGMTFDELRIPIPKGKLKEAIEVQNSLNLRRNIVPFFSES